MRDKALGSLMLITLGSRNLQRGPTEHVPKYAPFLHSKCTHPQPLHLIGAVLAVQCSWHYKLPEHVLRCPRELSKLKNSQSGAHMQGACKNWLILGLSWPPLRHRTTQQVTFGMHPTNPQGLLARTGKKRKRKVYAGHRPRALRK
eukprot:1144878-Pelagomonas_calceolata.AAC.3